MSKSEAKRHLILDSGLQVMMTNGYNGTSVKDIVDAANVPKGSFYNYFDSKESFAIEALEKVAEQNHLETSKFFRSSDTSAKEKLEQFIEMGASQCCASEFKVGCFLGNMCQEMAASSDAIRRKIQHALADMTGLIESALRQAQKEGDLSPDYEPEVLAEFLFNAWQGAMMRMKASGSEAPLEAFKQP